jgi:mRNA interferase RelE/StbE
VGNYRLLIKPSAAKEIEGLPKRDRQKAVKRIADLSSDPRPVGCEKLSVKEQYRVWQGKYRILYTINDTELVVVVVKVAHRKEAYH